MVVTFPTVGDGLLALLDSVGGALATAGRGVQRATVEVGQVVWDVGDQLSVYAERIYPSRRFPIEDSGDPDFGFTGLAAVVVVLLTRYVEVPQGVTAFTQPQAPDAALVTALHQTLYVDGYEVTCAVSAHCEANDIGCLFRGAQWIGPQGGVVTLEARFVIALD